MHPATGLAPQIWRCLADKRSPRVRQQHVYAYPEIHWSTARHCRPYRRAQRGSRPLDKTPLRPVTPVTARSKEEGHGGPSEAGGPPRGRCDVDRHLAPPFATPIHRAAFGHTICSMIARPLSTHTSLAAPPIPLGMCLLQPSVSGSSLRPGREEHSLRH